MKSKSEFLSLLMIVSLSLTLTKVQAANYYWRATAVNNLFTNVGNWETSPGGGFSPSTAPSVNDDVFFQVASSISAINLNNGNCRDFNVTTASPAAFTFIGIKGSINCQNGNTTFNFSGTQSMIGASTHNVFAI